MSTQESIAPDFSSLEHADLLQLANKLYRRLLEQDAIIDQLRQDFKDCMQVNRDRIAKE